ncbi:MAG: hypothetical protein JJE21_00645 [Spirochaetaceae bacterium]|nr:hypothetical protein [Spirochaetaceae bacterium]
MANCYIIKDKGKNHIITPFYKDKEIGNKDGEDSVVFFSSSSVNSSEIDESRIYTYKEIDNSVELWIQEKRYFPRLIISAFVFLIVYFFMSLVIRDPIPMLDELVGSTIASIAMWYYISTKDKKGPITNKKKLEIKRAISNSDYKELPALITIEMYLDYLRGFDIIDLSDSLLNVDQRRLKPFEFADKTNDVFMKQLTSRFKRIEKDNNSIVAKYFDKIYDSRLEKKKDEALSSKLIQLDRDAKIDLPLLSLLVIMSEYKVKTADFLN